MSLGPAPVLLEVLPPEAALLRLVPPALPEDRDEEPPKLPEDREAEPPMLPEAREAEPPEAFDLDADLPDAFPYEELPEEFRPPDVLLL